MPAFSSRPRIGITTSYADGEQRLRRDYVRAVEQAGGLPLPCPMLETDNAVRALCETLDGLILTGGPAVTDGLVGATPADLGALDPVRDASDAAYLDAFWTSDRPVLGICYGMQRLNARAGGTIYGDVERHVDGALPHSPKRGGTTHPVHLVETSRLRAALNTDTVVVNTRHLQAIASVGTDFAVSATAPDGVIEAIEHASGRMWGVQFHPERMGSTAQPLFRDFVEQAAAARPVPAS